MAPLRLALLPLVLVVSSVSSSDYMGSSLMFTPKGQDETQAYIVEVRTRHINSHCYQNNFTCHLGDCGTIIKSTYREINRDPAFIMPWCQNEVVTTIQLKTNQAFEIRYPTYLNVTTGHGYWAQTVKPGSLDWRMKAHIDMGDRSDSSKPNRSPIAAIMPTLRIPKNCKRSYELLVFDPDGDYIRCRVPATREGYDCSMCALPKGFSLLKNTCTLQFDAAATVGPHPIELVLDDFPTKSIYLTYSDGYYTKKCPISLSKRKRRQASPEKSQITPPLGNFVSTIGPLSIVPEQFFIYVDKNMAESCADGDYFPMFLPPTPRHGMTILAYAGRTVKVKVRMMAKNTLHRDLIVTGPKGFTKNQTFVDEYVIKWTPSKTDGDKYFPFCFVAEGTDKKDQIYQSKLRCFVVIVQSGGTTVTCNETSMKVEVKKSEYIQRYIDQVHLNDPACDLRLLSNNTHLVAVMALQSCGTTVEEDEDNIIFKNKITNGDPRGIISRHFDVDISFACAFPKKNNMTVGFRHRNIYSFTEKGFGVFNFQFDFFKSKAFNDRINSSQYPLEVSIQQMMYMQIQVITSVPQVELFVESCVAAPFVNSKSKTYSIIENGCVKDQTVEIYPSSELQFRFGMEAFEFISGYEEVYITCLVLLCEKGVPGTRCSQGCIMSTQDRHKRDTASESSRHSISQGPVRLIKPLPSTSQSESIGDKIEVSGSNLNMGLNLAFVIGCLLVVTLAVYELRRARAKYLAMQAARE